MENASPLKDHAMIWHGSGTCRCVAVFDIPGGGYARVYSNVVKVYKHNGDHVESKEITYCDCDCENTGKK